MDVHRIEGIKFNFDRLSTGELENIHGHLLEQHRRVTDEIGLVEGAIFARNHTERALGGAALNGQLSFDEVAESYEP